MGLEKNGMIVGKVKGGGGEELHILNGRWRSNCKNWGGEERSGYDAGNKPHSSLMVIRDFLGKHQELTKPKSPLEGKRVMKDGSHQNGEECPKRPTGKKKIGKRNAAPRISHGSTYLRVSEIIGQAPPRKLIDNASTI